MKVFINPGHSKNCKPDPGATGFKQKEANIAAKIGEALSQKLTIQGIDNVIYQQHEGTTSNTQLNKVAIVANESGADLFLSIHLNAAGPTVKGIETLYLGTSKNGKKFAELVNMELAIPFDSYTFVNRGVKADVRGLYVLKATSMPAALTEIGFITNEQDNKFVLNHIDEIAERLTNAILAYYNKEKKTFSNVTQISDSVNIRLELCESGKYNCYINNEKKLSENKLDTCLKWIKENYA